MGDLCRYFNTSAGCYFGDQCRFSHGLPYDMYSGWYQDRGRYRTAPPPPLPPPPPPPAYMMAEMQLEQQWANVRPCKFFNSPSGCRHGDRCSFFHENMQRPKKRNDHNNNHNNNNQRLRAAQQKHEKIKINEITCGECGNASKTGGGQTAKQNLNQHYMDKLAACDDKHIQYFLAEADFALRDLLCFACGRKFEEVQDLLHHFFRQVKTKNKKRFKHQEQLARIAKPFVDRDWNNIVNKTEPGTIENDGVKDTFTMKLLKCMVKPKDLLNDSKEGGTGSMMRNLARLARTTSESSGGSGSKAAAAAIANGTQAITNGVDEDTDGDDELDQELEDEIEERAKNYGFTQSELNELLSHGIKPWEDDEVDPWEFLEQLHMNSAGSSPKDGGLVPVGEIGGGDGGIQKKQPDVVVAGGGGDKKNESRKEGGMVAKKVTIVEKPVSVAKS